MRILTYLVLGYLCLVAWLFGTTWADAGLDEAKDLAAVALLGPPLFVAVVVWLLKDGNRD